MLIDNGTFMGDQFTAHKYVTLLGSLTIYLENVDIPVEITILVFCVPELVFVPLGIIKTSFVRRLAGRVRGSDCDNQSTGKQVHNAAQLWLP